MKRHFISFNAICMMSALVMALPMVCSAQTLDMNTFNASMSLRKFQVKLIGIAMSARTKLGTL